MVSLSDSFLAQMSEDPASKVVQGQQLGAGVTPGVSGGVMTVPFGITEEGTALLRSALLCSECDIYTNSHLYPFNDTHSMQCCHNSRAAQRSSRHDGHCFHHTPRTVCGAPGSAGRQHSQRAIITADIAS